MPAYKPYQPIDPSARMTRADFVVELLTMWEETLEIIRRNPSGTPEELGTKAELEAAIYVLKRSFPVSELMPVTSYDNLKVVVNKMELVWKRFNHDSTLINGDTNLTSEQKEQKLGERQKARDEELMALDGEPDASI